MNCITGRLDGIPDGVDIAADDARAARVEVDLGLLDATYREHGFFNSRHAVRAGHAVYCQFEGFASGRSRGAVCRCVRHGDSILKSRSL